jgi:hypothetical protein
MDTHEVEEWTPDDRRLHRLYRALVKMESEVDDLTAVVVAGTYFEYYVRQLIGMKADLSILETETQPLEMSVLIRMARALGVLPEDVARPLVGIVRLRNRFAHNVDYEFSDSDFETLVRRLTDQQRSDWEVLHILGVRQNAQHDTIAHKLRCYILCVRVLLEEVYDPVVLDEE